MRSMSETSLQILEPDAVRENASNSGVFVAQLHPIRKSQVISSCSLFDI